MCEWLVERDSEHVVSVVDRAFGPAAGDAPENGASRHRD
jgi:hypothetical protein